MSRAAGLLVELLSQRGLADVLRLFNRPVVCPGAHTGDGFAAPVQGDQGMQRAADAHSLAGLRGNPGLIKRLPDRVDHSVQHGTRVLFLPFFVCACRNILAGTEP